MSQIVVVLPHGGVEETTSNIHVRGNGAGDTLFAGLLEQVLFPDRAVSGSMKMTLPSETAVSAPGEKECGERGKSITFPGNAVPGNGSEERERDQVATAAGRAGCTPAAGLFSLPVYSGTTPAALETGFAAKTGSGALPLLLEMARNDPVRAVTDVISKAPLRLDACFDLPPQIVEPEDGGYLAVPERQDPADRFLSQTGVRSNGLQEKVFPLAAGSTAPECPKPEPVRPERAATPGESAVFFRENRTGNPGARPRGAKEPFLETPLFKNESGPVAAEPHRGVSAAGSGPVEPFSLTRSGQAGRTAGSAREDLLAQLGARITYLRERGNLPAEMRLQLKPPDLGEIAIRVSRQDGRLSVRFAAEVSAQELLRACLGELQQRLPQADFSLTRSDLGAAGPGASFSSWTGDGDRGQNRFIPDQSGGGAEVERPAVAPDTASFPDLQAGSFHQGINYWA